LTYPWLCRLVASVNVTEARVDPEPSQWYDFCNGPTLAILGIISQARIPQMSAGAEEAAYHEAGHCYLAVRDVGRVVDWMSIHREEEGWGGKTRIEPDFQSLLSWTMIAVAGAGRIGCQRDPDPLASSDEPPAILVLTGILYCLGLPH
jgi:hypothetical protein